MTNLAQAVSRAANIYPGGAAMVWYGKRTTWRELAEKVARVAGGLRHLGLTPGQRLGILAGNIPAHLEITYAGMWAGLPLVPMNTRLAEREMEQIIASAELSALACEARFLAQAQKLAGQSPSLRNLILLDDAPESEGLIRMSSLATAAGVEIEPMTASSLATINYTGGTTGTPKGVMLSHGNYIVQSLSLLNYHEFDSDTVYLHAAPLFHLADGCTAHALTYATGTHAFLRDFHVIELQATLSRDGVNQIMLAPTMLAMLIDHPSFDQSCFGGMETITYGSSPMTESVLARLMDAFPKLKFLQFYGMTELCGSCTALRPDRHVLAGPKQGKLRTAGQPTFPSDVRIVNDAGTPVGPGIQGEIVVRGPQVMLGYWREPDLTAQTIRDGWLHTGDAGVIDEDGFITVLDRMKDMIVSGGENVYSGEVENALASHPAVSSCAVIGVPDPIWGERVHAVVVPKPDQIISADALIAHCRKLIAGYKCPKSMEVREAPLPLSQVGKVRKNLLREEYSKRVASKGINV